MKKRIILMATCLAMMLSLFAGCAKPQNPNDADGDGEIELPQEESLADIAADFSAELIKQVANENKQKNIIISPMSVLLALSMTANGAQGTTLGEMEATLSSLPLGELNGLLREYLNDLDGIDVANSVFIKEDIADKVKDSFRNTCIDVYGAEIFCESFDGDAVDKINGWVCQKTNGMIDQLVEELSHDTVMMLLNAVCFDGEWADKYDPDDDVSSGVFLGLGGTVKSVDYMVSVENKYIKTDNAEGFIKDYKGRFSFLALVPDSDISVYDYIKMLDGEEISKAISSANDEKVKVWLPKFSYESELELSGMLSNMGMREAFNEKKADFCGIAEIDGGNLFISKVLHKARVTVDTDGTCAAAATGVQIDLYGAIITDMNVRSLAFERPFVYMIIDREAGLPVFVGVVTEPDDAQKSNNVIVFD